MRRHTNNIATTKDQQENTLYDPPANVHNSNNNENLHVYGDSNDAAAVAETGELATAQPSSANAAELTVQRKKTMKDRAVAAGVPLAPPAPVAAAARPAAGATPPTPLLPLPP